MSAYVVSKATIDAIVSVWRALKVEAGEIAPAQAMCDSMGRNLWRENEKSVESLYIENHPSARRSLATREALGEYRFTPIALPADLSVALPRALGEIRNLIYQSCERSCWERTPACRFLTKLRATVEKRCPLVRKLYRAGPSSPDRVPYSWGFGMSTAAEGEQFAYLWEDDFKRACEARRAS